MTKQAEADALWERLLNSDPGPTLENFETIMISYPELRDRAWWSYLGSGPGKDSLLRLIEISPANRGRAWETLQNVEGVTFFDLKSIIDKCEELRVQAVKFGLELASPEDLPWFVRRGKDGADEAWTKLAELKYPEIPLRDIATYSCGHREEAERILRERYPTVRNLRALLGGITDTKEGVARELMALGSNEALCAVITDYEPLRDEAWENLKASTPTCEELMGIVYATHPYFVPAVEMILEIDPSRELLLRLASEFRWFRDAAYGKLLKMEPSEEELLLVIRSSDVLRAEAWSKLSELPPTNAAFLELVGRADGFARLAGERYIELHPEKPQVLWHGTSDHGLVEQAWESFLETEQANDPERFISIAGQFPSLRKRALERVMELAPTRSQLVALVEMSKQHGYAELQLAGTQALVSLPERTEDVMGQIHQSFS